MIGIDRAGRLRRAAASFLAAIAIGVLVVLAIRADAAAPHASPWLTTLDIATGLAFVIAAVVARGSSAERLLMAVVGVAWLTASFLPAARSLHQAVLVVSLVAFPAGRVRGLTRWLLACLAVPVGFGLLPQIGVAARVRSRRFACSDRGPTGYCHRLPDGRGYRRGGRTRRVVVGLASAGGSLRSDPGFGGL